MANSNRVQIIVRPASMGWCGGWDGVDGVGLCVLLVWDGVDGGMVWMVWDSMGWMDACVVVIVLA